MTRFEAEVWQIEPYVWPRSSTPRTGRCRHQHLLRRQVPLIARRQAEAGARPILVALWTESLAGYHRRSRGPPRDGRWRMQRHAAWRRSSGLSPWLGRLRGGYRRRRRRAPPDRFFRRTALRPKARSTPPAGWTPTCHSAPLDAVPAHGEVPQASGAGRPAWDRRNGRAGGQLVRLVGAGLAATTGQPPCRASDVEAEHDGARPAHSG